MTPTLCRIILPCRIRFSKGAAAHNSAGILWTRPQATLVWETFRIISISVRDCAGVSRLCPVPVPCDAVCEAARHALVPS